MTAVTDRNDLLRGAARGGGLAAAGGAIAAVLGFLLTLVITRGLSTTSAGQFFTATAVFLILQTFVSFGVGAGLVRFVPRLRALNRDADIPALLVMAFLPVVAIGVLGSTALWVAAPELAHRLSADGPAPTEQGLRMLAFFLLVGVLELGAVECTRAFGNISRYVLIQQILVPLSRPLLVLIALGLDASLGGVLLAWAIPLVGALVLAAIVIARQLRQSYGRVLAWPVRTCRLRELAREYWSFTSARGVAGAIDIVLTWLNVLLLAALGSPAQAAIYAAATRFITSGTLVMQALRLATATELSARLARADIAGAGALYRVSTQWVVLTSWPLYITMGVFAPTVLAVFGPTYVEGSTALSILCAAMLVNLAAGNVGSALLMGGKSAWVLGDKLVALAVNVIASLLLIPPLGVNGAAIAWGLTIVIDSAIAFAQVHRGMGLSGRGDGVITATALALITWATVTLTARAVWGSTVLTLGSSVVIAAALYGLGLWRRRDLLELGLLFSALRPGRRRRPWRRHERKVDRTDTCLGRTANIRDQTAVGFVQRGGDTGGRGAVQSCMSPADDALIGQGAGKVMSRVGYAPGVYDLFHVGHLNILRHARSHCDFLIAGVVSDELARRAKGKAPVVPLPERLEIVQHISYRRPGCRGDSSNQARHVGTASLRRYLQGRRLARYT